MVRTNSMILELGFQLPNFQMLNTNSPNNQYFNSHNLDNRHLLLMFICAPVSYTHLTLPTNREV